MQYALSFLLFSTARSFNFSFKDITRLVNDLQTITENDVLSNGILKFVHAFVLKNDRSGQFIYDDVDAIVTLANEIIGYPAVKVETGSGEFQHLVHLLSNRRLLQASVVVLKY